MNQKKTSLLPLTPLGVQKVGGGGQDAGAWALQEGLQDSCLQNRKPPQFSQLANLFCLFEGAGEVGFSGHSRIYSQPSRDVENVK